MPDKFHQILKFEPHKRRAVVRMKADKTVNPLKLTVKHHLNLVAFVVDNAERRNLARVKPEMLLQSFVRAEAQPRRAELRLKLSLNVGVLILEH